MQPNRRVIDRPVAWAGVHGEERGPGRSLVESLWHKAMRYEDPSTGTVREVQCFLANWDAVMREVRYIDHNLALCLTDPDRYSGHEARLAKRMLKDSEDYDLITDWHTNMFTEKNYAYIGRETLAYVLGFVATMPFKIDGIIVTNDSFPGRFPQAAIFDIAPHTKSRNGWPLIIDIRNAFWNAITKGVPVPTHEDLSQFTFYASTTLTNAECRRISEKRTTAPVAGEIMPDAAEILGLPGRPVFSIYGPPGYTSEVAMGIPSSLIRIEAGEADGPIIRAPTLRDMARCAIGFASDVRPGCAV